MTAPAGSLRALAAAAAALLLALGCLGTTPPAHFYTIAAGPAPPASSEPTADDLAVLVGPVTLPRYLDRPQIVTRERGSEARVHVDELHRWAGGLGAEVGRVLAFDLARRLGSNRVAVHPATPAFGVDYRVAVDVLELDGRLDGDLVLRARFTVEPGGRPTAGREERGAVESVHFTERVDPQTYEGLSRAHGRALSSLAEAIAARLAALPAD